MVDILKDHDLHNLNTFGLKAKAKFFAVVGQEPDILELFKNKEFKDNQKLFLGGGSNVLFTKDFDGIVILNKLKGIEIVEESLKSVLIRSMAGELWHDLVSFAVERGLWGIENLSLIPGTVGAAPVQNIGAYGVEIKDILESVEAYDIETGIKKIFFKKECKFGYRDSVFKKELKNKYFILSITIKLSKINKPNISYKILQEYLVKNKIEIKNSKDVSNIVAEIRRSKLPDPKVLGNAGSFFKNVYVSSEIYMQLLKKYPSMPSFEEPADAKALAGGERFMKIPAGWLIEQSGWKGKKIGNVGVHERQALVLVNYGGATGEEIKDLADQIIASVFEKFKLQLFPEVNII